MAKISKNVVAIGIIVACIFVFAGLKLYQSQAGLLSSGEIKLAQRAKGNPKAAIKIVEFIDFQCPACAKGSKLLHEYMEKYPEKIYLELRYYPLAMHSHGLSSAKWGECAARQGKFWPFLDSMLEKQKEWYSLVDITPPFTFIAKEVGIDVDALKACLVDPSVDQAISVDVEEGKMRKVASTPSYLIDHELVVGTKSLTMKLDDLLGIKDDK